MKSFLHILMVVCISCLPLRAQHATAPNGYYPHTYSGSIFTGSLESVVPDTQEITLVYTKGSKTERFVGRLESTCSWKDKQGTVHSFTGSDLPKGTVLTTFYTSSTKKSGGEKITENSIFAVSYAEQNGKRIPDERRVLIPCSEQKFTFFKVF
jgi:hypothetical protein